MQPSGSYRRGHPDAPLVRVCITCDPAQSGDPTCTGGTTLALVNPGSQSGTVGTATSLTLSASGGTTPYTFSATGLPPPTATWPMSPVNLVAEERTIKGSYIGTCVPSRDLPRFIDLYRQGRMPVNRLMSGKLALDEINKGFDLLHEGKAVRQVVVF